MNSVQGTIKNGQIILDAPAALPEGTRVEVLSFERVRPTLGMREEDWPTTPEGIEALLTRMDSVEPGWLSPEDDATWRAALQTQKEIEKAQFSEDWAMRMNQLCADSSADDEELMRRAIEEHRKQAKDQVRQ